MKPARRHAPRALAPHVMLLVAFAFVAGMVAMAVVARTFPTVEGTVASDRADAGVAEAAHEPVNMKVKPSVLETPPAVTSPPTNASRSASPPAISADPIAELRQRHLTLPLPGIERSDIRAGFNEMRAGARRHEAIDVLAPRHTPVLAVEDGTVARLFVSQAGGITVYQFDPTERYIYYYAHLENYAAGLKEKSPVKRGEMIGYVGTSGNAPRDTPHLHFAIFRVTDEKKWWKGTPIDPYSVLR